MLIRDISGPGRTRALRSLLESLFAAELLAPSKPLWIFFAWVTDLPMLDNSARQFSALCPEWPTTKIRLSELFAGIVRRGGSINLVIRDAIENDQFIERLKKLKEEHCDSIRWCKRPNFHEKGMLGSNYVLDGSMNLTIRGLEVNDEHVILRCGEPSEFAERHIELMQWESHLE